MSEEGKAVETRKNELPSAEEVKSSVRVSEEEASTAQQKYEAIFRGVSLESERKYAHLVGLKEHYNHKKYWSFFIMKLMLLMVVFQCVLLWKAGTGQWDFSRYQWLLPALLVQNLAQVVGLAVFVVKALFKDMDWK